jgi:hypothetical protein
MSFKYFDVEASDGTLERPFAVGGRDPRWVDWVAGSEFDIATP